MAKKKNYIFMWHRNPLAQGLLVHILSGLSMLALVIYCMQNHRNITTSYWILYSTIASMVILLNVAMFIYSFFFGWNRPVYFDKEKIWQKIKGQIYEWRWEDMSECEVKVVYVNNPYTLHIKTIADYKELSFMIDDSRFKELIRFCPNEKTTELLKNTFKKHWEMYHGKPMV